VKVLAVNVDPTTVEFLLRHAINADLQKLESPEEFEHWATADEYGAVIVDLDLSGVGVYAGRIMRNKGSAMPLIGICEKPEGSWAERRAQFLENGGDDLLCRPINPRELIASLRAAMRRYQGALHEYIERACKGAQLKMDLTTHSVRINGEHVHLTNKELLIMLAFARSPGRVLSKEAIMTTIYSGSIDDEPEIKIIDVFVCKIRKHLADVHPDAEHFIETAWGRGYRLRNQDELDQIRAAA